MAKKVQFIDRQSAKVVEKVIAEAEASIDPQAGAAIRIDEATRNVTAYARDGEDLIITFADGTTLRIEGYFACPVEERSEIILFDEQTGEAWRAVPDEAVCYPAAEGTSPASFHYEPLSSVSEGGAWMLPAALLAGAAGVAAVASGGGSTPPPSAPPPPSDTTAPAAPVLSPSNGSVIRGTAEPGSTIRIDVNGDGTPDLTTVADAGGNWSVTPAAPLANGTTIRATATDAAGNTSTPAQGVVDAVAPAAPVVNPTNGTTISGTAEPGATVRIDINGDGAADFTVVAGANGSWTVTPPTRLADGTAVTATATDAAGNTSGPGRAVVDSNAPAAPVIDPSNGTVISGSAEACSTVKIDVNGDGTPDFTVVAGADGRWSVTPGTPIADGATITATATDPTGNVSGPATAVVDATAPAAPVVNPSNGTVIGGTAEPDSTVEVDVDGDGEPDFTTVTDPSGNWSVTPDTPLPDGTPITVVATDPAGNTSPPTQIVVDATAPAAPVVDPSNGTVIGGTAQPGSTVEVDVDGDGEPDFTTVTDPSGNWSVTPDAPLPDGTPVTVVATDPAGNSSPPTQIVVDATAPAAPVVDPSNGTVIGGTAEPGSTVEVDVDGDGEPDFTTVTDPSGNWSVTPDAPLPDGTPVTVVATDPAGNTSPPTQIVVDATAPAAPVVDPSNGTVIGGTAEPGSTVEVDVDGDGEPDFTTVTDPSGNWSVTPDTPLPDGTPITVVATDPAGNTSPPTQIVVDATAPAAPVVDPTNGTVIGGTAEPGSTVEVDVDGDGEPDFTTVTDPSGNWSVTPDTPLPDGTPITVVATDPAGNTSPPTQIVVDATAPAAPVVDPSNGTVIGGTAEPGSTVEVDVDGDGEPDFTTVTDPSGNWSVTPDTPLPDGTPITVVATDPAGNTSPPTQIVVDATAPTITITGPIEGDDIVNATEAADGTVVGGTTNAEDGQIVTVTFASGGNEITTTAEVAGGAWNVALTPAQVASLGEGAVLVTASVSDRAGNNSAPATQSFTVDTIAPAAPTSTSLTDDVGSITGPIASGGITDDTQPTFAGNGAAPGSTVNIYDNGALIGSTTADGSGNWAFTPGTPLASGPHSLTASTVDAAGNESAQTAPIAFTVDTSAPATAPTITGVSDDVAPVTGPVGAGTATNDARPTIIGNGAEPNSTVNVYDNGTLIGSAVADAGGAWSFTPSANLVDGPHSFTVSNVDTVGNEGPQSATPYDITVDTAAPAAPTSTSLTDDVGSITGPIASGGVTDDTQPTFVGNGAAPGSTVNIYDNGALIGSTTADGSGNWTFTPGTPLASGPHSLTASTVDAAGNESAQTAPIAFTVDTSAPAAVVSIDSISDDTGIVGDFVTSDTSLTVFGHLDAPLAVGERLQISIDNGASWIDVVPTATNWTYTDARSLSAGSYDYQARILSSSGVGGAVTTQTVTVDVSAPPAIQIDSISDDTGAAGDFVTSDTSLTVNGSIAAPLQPSETAQISIDGGISWIDLVVTGTSWSYADSRVLGDGSYDYQVRTIDTAGNVTADLATVTVDTSAPGAITIDSLSDDTGESATDFVTSDTTPTLSGRLAAPLAAGETAQVSIDGGAWIELTDVAGTNWSFVAGTLADGSYEYRVRIVDASGNAGPIDTQIVEIDTTLPGLLTTVEILDSIDPTRGVIIDGTTINDSSPEIRGTGAEANSIVNIYNGEPGSEVLIGSTRADAAGNWSFTPPAPLADNPVLGDPYAWSAANVDAAGVEGNKSAPIRFRIDTLNPADSTIVAISDDSGASNTDFITNDPTITLSGIFSQPLIAGDVAQISVDGGATWVPVTVTGGGTSWTYTPPAPLADGVYFFEVVVVDAADNVGQSDTQKVVIDTTAPGAIAIVSIDVDSGASTSDFITSDTTIIINGTLAAPLAVDENAETAQISLDGGATWFDLVVNGTSWSYADGRTLADGPVDYQVRIIDRAGNVGPVDTQTVVIDTAPPAISTITGISDDTGVAADFITSDTSLTVNGSLSAPLAPGDRAQISVDGGANWIDVAVTGTTWSYVDGRTLADGSYTYQTRTIDQAGNIQVGASQIVTVDTAAPAKTISIDSITDDTGASASDFLTADTMPTVFGHLSAALTAGETAQISIDGGVTWSALTVIGTGWSYDVPTMLAEGANTLVVRVIDAAGNAGTTSSQVVTIDTTAPPATAAIVSYSDDVGTVTGSFGSGTSTDDTSPVLNGTLSSPAQVGELVRIYAGATLVGTVALAAGDTSWTFSGLSGLADGTYDYTARLVDTAGNESADSATFTLVVDAEPPSVILLTIDAVVTDTWFPSAIAPDESADFITRDTTLAVGGRAEIDPDGILQISSDGGATWATVTVTGGIWRYDDPVERTSDVTYQLRVIDASGNVSPTTASRLVTVDIDAPIAGTLAPVLTADTGVLGDSVTASLSLGFTSALSGLKEAGSTIQLIHDVNNNGIYEQGLDQVLAIDSSSGTSWSLSTSILRGATYNLGFVQYDAAGNYSRLSPTTEVLSVNTDIFGVGLFGGTTNTGASVNDAAGMSAGVNQLGQLQFAIRRSVLTQTSLNAGTTETPTAVTGETISNSTFFDFNRDGNLDFATSSNAFGDSSQSIFVGQSNGTHVGYRQNVGATSANGGVVAFDRNGDGFLETIWGDWGNDNASLSTVINTGGVLSVASILASGNTVVPDREVSGVDIDNDGDIDLAMHSFRVNGVLSANALTTLLNNGSGTYSLGQTTPAIFNNTANEAGNAVSMTWADFDGDGDLDLYLNRTDGTNVSGIYTNTNGVIGAAKTAIGDITGTVNGGASLAIDWDRDGKMDVVEFTNSTTSGPIRLYLNTSTAGSLSFTPSSTLVASASNVGGASAVDYDWDGDVDVVYQLAGTGEVRSVANTNQVQDGTALHLRIVDQNGVNSYYGNTVQLFDSQGRLVATQILNPQSGVGTNDSTGIVHFYGLSATESYTAVLVRTVNGVSEDVGGVASLTDGAAPLSTIENVNTSWTNLTPGASTGSYVLSGEGGAAVNNGTFAGTGYNDTFHGGNGNDSFVGGGGWSMGLLSAPVWSTTGGTDVVDYAALASVSVNLATGQAVKAGGTDTLTGIEGIRGTAGNDTFADNAADNTFEGRGGNDTIALNGGGRDVLTYKMLDAGDATGGNGADVITGFTVGKLATTGSADIIDLRDLLRDYRGTAYTYIDNCTGQNVLDFASRGLTAYLNVEISGADTLIQVDIDGTGNFTTVATLTGVNTTLADLLANNQLWVASSDTGPALTVNALATTDTTPIVTGTLPMALESGDVLRVVVNGVTYRSDVPNQVVVDPLNQTWYVQVPTALATGTYNVTAAVFNADGSVAMQDRTLGELTVTPQPVITFGGSGGAANKATAVTIGENGVWRIFSNDTVYDSTGATDVTLGSYSATSITVAGQQTQNATFMDYNRDGFIDIFGIDQDFGNGQQAWTYNGSSYAPFQVGGSGATSANVFTFYAGVIAYDKTGDGFVDLAYGDGIPNDSEAGGGYDTQFVVNNGGTFIKDGNYVNSNTGTPPPTNINNASPHKELSGVDINNDGTVDVVYHGVDGSNTAGGVTSSNSGRLVVVSNSGNGALTNTQILDNVFINDGGSTSYSPSMTWADFNGDGMMDLFLGRGRTNAAGTVTDSNISRIHYNDGGTIVSSLTGPFATTYLGDTVAGGASIALDWNTDGRMDVIELPRFDITSASTVNLYTNNGGGSFSTTSLGAVTTSDDITGAVAIDVDWDGDRDLIFTKAGGTTTYVQNTNQAEEGTVLHLRIVDANGINAFMGNTVQLYDAAGNLVASQIINPQSGNQTNDSSALVDFYGLDPLQTYTAVLVRNVNGISQDVGGSALAGANAIENVNATWQGLTPGAATHGYVLTAESGTNAANTVGVGIVGTGYNDTFFATLGNDTFNGGGGWRDGTWSNTGGEDVIDFRLAGATGVTVDLRSTAAQNTGFGTVTLKNIEGVAGGAGNDVFTGDAADNTFEGRGGNDIINLEAGGRDTVMFKLLDAANATGGNGADTVNGFKVGTYDGTPGSDRIDLADLLSGYVGDADGAARYLNGIATIDAGDAIADYVQVTVSGNNTVISIDRDGLGTDYDFTDVVTLNDVQTNLATLLANNQLVVA